MNKLDTASSIPCDLRLVALPKGHPSSPTFNSEKQVNIDAFKKKKAKVSKLGKKIEHLQESLEKLMKRDSRVASPIISRPKRKQKGKKQSGKKDRFVINGGEEISPYGDIINHDRDDCSLLSFLMSKSPSSSTYSGLLDSVGTSGSHSYIYDHIEGILLLCVSMRDSKSYIGMISSFLTYCRAYHIKSSIVTTICSSLEEVHDKYVKQSGVDDICDFFDKWTEFVRMPAFNYVGRILAVCVSLGLCSASQLKYSVKGINLFAVEALKRQASASDLLDAVVSTVRYFLSAGVEAFKTRSLRPFLFSNQRLARLDALYCDVNSAMIYFSSGNLSSCKIKTEPDLSASLTKLLDELNALKGLEKDPIMRRTLDQRLIHATEWQSQFLARSTGGQLRQAPYTFLIWGRSGVGKSAISMNMIRTLLCSNDFNFSDSTRIVTINPADKFISNAKADTLAYIFDDMGAEATKSAECNHARRWLDMSNNIAGYATKADIADKGLCTFNHKLQVGTSNFQDGGMDLLATYPVAVARRGTRDLIRLKPAFADSSGIADSAKIASGNFPNPNFPDIYDITVEIAQEDVNNPGQYQMVPDNFQGVPMVNVSYETYAKYHIARSQAHFQNQTRWVSATKQAPNNLFKCGVCAAPNSLCVCAKGPTFVEKCKRCTSAVSMCSCFQGPLVDRCKGCSQPPQLCACPNGYQSQFGVEGITRPIAAIIVNRAGNALVNRLQATFATLNTSLLNYLPNWILYHPVTGNIVRYLITQRMRISPAFWNTIIAIVLSLSCYFYAYHGMYACNLWFLCVGVLFLLSALVNNIVFEILVRLTINQRDAFQARLRDIRNTSLYWILGGVFIASLIKAYDLVTAIRKYEKQGNLTPTCTADIEARDKEVNMWASVVTTPLKVTAKAERSCFEHLHNIVKKNQLYVSCDDGGKRPFSNAFMAQTGFCILPTHMLFRDPREYIFQRADRTSVGTSFRAVLSLDSSVRIDKTDLSVVYIPSCGDYKDLTDYFPLSPPTKGWASLVYKTVEGKFLDETSVRFCRKTVESEDLPEPLSGLGYNLPYNTFKGLCGGSLIMNGKKPVIIGSHSLGKPDSNEGCASIITLPAYKEAMTEYINKFRSIVVLPDVGDIHESQHGIEYFESTTLHAKSPLNFVDPELISSCNIYGSVIGRNKTNSLIRPTSLCNKVREVFERPLLYGPPKFHLGRHWNTHLNKCLKPSLGCDQTILETAFQDYIKPLRRLVTDRVAICPLSNSAIVNGIDGLRFIDRMKVSTSMGFPINKSKEDFLTPCEGPNDVNFDFGDEIWADVRTAEECYLQGKRFYPIFRACLKDEVKSAESTKVRVFEAAPITLQILIRKYFLPIARIISFNPIVSECAVGINAVSKEWDQMIKHATKFGKDRMIAGDYSGYDTRMPAQFTIAAFKVFIDLAELSGGYTKDDLKVMESLVADVVHPLIAFNGDLLMLFGTNPSGQNLTVYINSIVNSLYIRCIYYCLYAGDFRTSVSLITYGDDFLGSVRKERDEFTMAVLVEKFKDMDITLTLPNKTAFSGDFVPFKDCDFLKRSTFFHPELQHEVGLLEEESILKSLCFQLVSSSVTRDEQLAGAVASALTEYFYYGREVYEDRRRKLQIVFEGFPLRIDELGRDYDLVCSLKEIS